MEMHNDIAYKISCELFSKMSKEQLIAFKKEIESEPDDLLDGAIDAKNDILSDLERYMKENNYL